MCTWCVCYFQFSVRHSTQHDPISLKYKSKKHLQSRNGSICFVFFRARLFFPSHLLVFHLYQYWFYFYFFSRCIDGIFICHKYCTFGHNFDGYMDRRFQFYANQIQCVCVLYTRTICLNRRDEGQHTVRHRCAESGGGEKGSCVAVKRLM